MPASPDPGRPPDDQPEPDRQATTDVEHILDDLGSRLANLDVDPALADDVTVGPESDLHDDR